MSDKLFLQLKLKFVYPTAFLCTIGQPQPLADLQFEKVTVIKNNNKTDM